MRVQIRLFARLRDLAGSGSLTEEVPDGSTVATVWARVVDAHAALEPYAASMSVAVNADYARMDTPVEEGDEVAFLPPVSGGM